MRAAHEIIGARPRCVGVEPGVAAGVTAQVLDRVARGCGGLVDDAAPLLWAERDAAGTVRPTRPQLSARLEPEPGDGCRRGTRAAPPSNEPRQRQVSSEPTTAMEDMVTRPVIDRHGIPG